MASPDASFRLASSAGALAAQQLAAQLPEHFADWRVAVAEIARALEIEVERRTDLRVPARWCRMRTPRRAQPTLWDVGETEAEHDLVLLRADLPEGPSRFALAHEIGHAVLHRDRAMSARIQGDAEERYASAFAAELLLPSTRAPEVRKMTRNATDPIHLLHIASSMAISPQTVLLRADRDQWLAGIDRVWLDIRVVPNRQTGRDRRPRVHRAILDRRRWLLPSNRSIAGAFGDDAWMTGLQGRRVLKGTIDISCRVDGGRARWVHRDVPACAIVRRLRQHSLVPGIDYLGCVQLGGR